MRRVVLVGAGPGNIGSVSNMLGRLHTEVVVTRDPEVVRSAEKLILPGVGAFDTGIAALRAEGLDRALHQAVDAGAQLLGICLGMQLIMDGSDEGSLPGLGLVPGRARRFKPDGNRIRVPHMGWNVVRPTRPCVLLSPGEDEQRFYFVHSYYIECDDATDSAGITSYGVDFTSVIERGRVLGVQFHPEKSHRFGMALLERFVEA